MILCKICTKKEVKKYYKSCLCSTCYNNEWYKKIKPEHKEKIRKRMRDRRRIEKGIDPNLPRLIAENGMGCITPDGYRSIIKRGHPNARTRGQLLEHTYVMSEYLGRPIRKDESIHHKNGIRSDNRIENLEIWHRGQPPGQRLEDKLKWAKEFLESYGYEVSENGKDKDCKS